MESKSLLCSCKHHGCHIFRAIAVRRVLYSHSWAASATPDIKLMRDASSTESTDIYINQNDGNCGEKSPCYSTIQAGIDAANDASTVNIAQGTYTESLSLNSPKTITLKGGWNDDFSAQENITVIQAPKVGNGGTLKMRDIVIRPVVEATPVLSYLFPATTYAGASDQTLTLLGSNFVEGATVNFNGVSRETTLVSATHLTTEITATELANAGTYSVSVTNPGAGGKTSGSLNFTLLALTFGETDISTPDWTAATHEKLDAEEIMANMDTVFDTAQVQRMDITIDAANWSVMQSNLADLKAQLGGSNDFSLMDDPIDVPCDIEYNGKQW